MRYDGPLRPEDMVQFEGLLRPDSQFRVRRTGDSFGRTISRKRSGGGLKGRIARWLAYGPLLAGLSALALALAPHGARAEDAGPDASPDPAGSSGYPQGAGVGDGAGGLWAFHAQSTFTGQGVTGFHAPYAGANSLKPNDLQVTWDVTAYIGARPWKGVEVWANPEVDQGFGVGNTLGAAGYTSGEAYKVGKVDPYVRLQRLFARQTFNLGGDSVGVEAGPNQFAGHQRADRIVVTVGKFGVGDVFDTNRYAHDPRGDFLNWAVIESGAFDYAADAWGFSYGASAEWYEGAWTARFGAFNLSKDPNGSVLGSDFAQTQMIAEGERRWAMGGHAGSLRVGVWSTHGRLARFDDAIAWGILHSTAPDAMQVRKEATRWGGYVNLDQELSPALGAFLRASTADGNYASYEFTDIDTSLSGGLVLSGAVWRRPADSVGLAFSVNAASGAMKRYLAAGGLGLLVGDGQLPHSATETVIEANYSWHPLSAVAVTFDYQLVVNPAYNRDRGPANVLGVRLHAGF